MKPSTITKTMRPNIPLRQALADPHLLGNVLKGDSWRMWRTLLIAAMGEPLTADERVLFQEMTGRDREPLERVEDLVGVVGRRGGKTRAISVVATYVSALCQHPSLVGGETGVVLIIAPDQRQADVCLDYVEANFRQSPILSQLIESRTQRSLRLTNKIEIEVRASNFRRLRGPTYAAVIADESAWWLNTDTSSNPDSEILSSVRPGLATTGGPLFLISSPYARRGELWRLYNKHYGPHGDPRILVAQGSSRQFNPSLPQRVVDRAYERDPVSAAAEHGGEFRSDLEAYVSIEAVERCTVPGRRELPYVPGQHFVAFCDPSGGSGGDSMTMAVAARNGDVVTIYCARERRPPYSPDHLIGEFCDVLDTYHVRTITGDRFGGLWCQEPFRKQGITYKISEQPKSDIYRDALPLINSGRLELLDLPRLKSQLIGLERSTSRSGRETFQHSPGAHDDLVNSVLGAALLASAKKAPIKIPDKALRWSTIPNRYRPALS
jgi:hypothetical protein